jgi:hypothetical protein
MSERRIPPDQSEHLPPYFERNAADVKPEEWPTYEPLAYEVWMLEAVARRLAALPADESLRDEDRPLKNALLESFALHFRNLAEFLWPSKNPRRTDVAIGHFTQGWSPNQPRPDDLFDRVGREVGHLTTYRLSGDHPRKRWDVVDCIRVLRVLDAVVQRPNAANRLPPRMADLVERLGRLRNDAASTRYFDPPVNATTHTGRAGIYP